MKLMLIGLFLLLSLITSIKSDSDSFKRNVTVILNPNCKNDICKDYKINIIYVKAVSKDDVLHYLYAGGNFTETLSVIIIRSQDLTSTLNIDYNNLKNGFKNKVINFSGKVDGAFGLIFTNLYEYNDIHDKVDMNGNTVNARPFDNFIWNQKMSNTKTFSFISKSLKNNSDSLLSLERMIEIQFNISDSKGYGMGLPHLIFTGNNTHISFILNNLKPSWPNSRFAVEVALINNLNIGNMYIKTVKSLDDEKSPGVFQIKNFFGQNSDVNWENSTYLQWKPVCYLSDFDRSINNISLVNFSPVTKLNLNSTVSNIIKSSIAYIFFGDQILDSKSSMSLINLTFGISEDKFYNNSKYLIWSSSFGQGVAPEDSISIGVIMVIAFGLGLPFVLVVIGSIYLIIKKRLRRRVVYETIEDPINS